MALLPVMAAGLSHSLPTLAAVLEMPAAQVLEPGQALRVPLVLREGEGPRIEIRLGAAPEGAKLLLNDEGQLQLDWQTGIGLPVATRIELQVRDVDSGEYQESVFVVVQRAGASDSAPAGEPQAAIDGRVEAPDFNRIPNQVVNAGRIITLKVAASLSGPINAVLQVDRLPRHASFEANGDGSRTFRWETDDKDEGEHLFRFTAFNPRSPEHRTAQEVLIVVGDPTKSVTFPEPLPEPVAETTPAK